MAFGLTACTFAFDPDGRVLLVQSKDRRDTWEPPGGVVEDGESPAEAACREAYEEARIAVRLTGCSGVYHHVAARRLCVAFLARGCGEPRPSDETPGARWFTVREADAAITRPSLRLRWTDAIAMRETRPGGYADYATRPFSIERRMTAGGGGTG